MDCGKKGKVVSTAKWLSHIKVDQEYVAVFKCLYASVSKTSGTVVEISTQPSLLAGQMFGHPLLRTVTHRHISASNDALKMSTISMKSHQEVPRV